MERKKDQIGACAAEAQPVSTGVDSANDSTPALVGPTKKLRRQLGARQKLDQDIISGVHGEFLQHPRLKPRRTSIFPHSPSY